MFYNVVFYQHIALILLELNLIKELTSDSVANHQSLPGDVSSFVFSKIIAEATKHQFQVVRGIELHEGTVAKDNWLIFTIVKAQITILKLFRVVDIASLVFLESNLKQTPGGKW